MRTVHHDDVHRGARIYSKTVLSFYDLLVVRLSNTFAWRCPSQRMLQQYNELMGLRHLDVGPGTGWYLAHAQLPQDAEITLMDLNDNSLDAASARLPQITQHRVVADVLQPMSDQIGSFQSIGINYLLHCLPGTWAEKSLAIQHLSTHLSQDGVLFGGTILGSGVEHNLAGRSLMKLYNRLGIFHNAHDDVAGLQKVLEQQFELVQVDVIETVAVFRAARPRR